MPQSFFYFIFKRLISLPFILLGISLLTFLIIRLVPVEPEVVLLRLANIPPTQEAVANMSRELGTDKPLFIQYGIWLIKVCQLNFGTSFVSKLPVAEELSLKIPATLELASVAFVFIVSISLFLGVMFAIFQNRIVVSISRIFSILGVSIPGFWLGFMLLSLFSLKLGWLPTHGKGGILHLVLPAFTLALPSIAVLSRLLSNSILEQLKEPYVYYARTRGLKERTIIWSHIMKNALIPVVSILGITIGNLLSGSVIVEQVFGWPGLGRYLIDSITNRDYPVIQSYVLILAVIYVMANLMMDIVHRILDPKLSSDRGKTL